MDVDIFIKALAAGIKDPSLLVISVEDWRDILNFQAGELFPEIGIRGSAEINAPTDAASYQIDLSGSTYKDLEEVKQVFLKDTAGKQFLYENWIYNREIQLLDLNPQSSKIPEKDPADYDKVIVVWQGYMPEVSKDTDVVDLKPPKLALLKKICIKEAMRRILLDHTKLDRYRTLVGRTNEYALLAMIRDLTTEIEIGKRRLVDTHSVRTF